jgi:hypothetical protein
MVESCSSGLIAKDKCGQIFIEQNDKSKIRPR